jgi:hypothetical protein
MVPESEAVTHVKAGRLSKSETCVQVLFGAWERWKETAEETDSSELFFRKYD